MILDVMVCRSYELVAGVLQVFTGEGDQRQHEFDMHVADCFVEMAALPGKPHCILIKPVEIDGTGA